MNTKRTADRLQDQLWGECRIRAAPLHGDLSQHVRERTLDQFRKEAVRVLVATDVAARGLDVSNVAHVVNFDMPHSVDDYVHRIGRTGRAGHTGHATSLFDPRSDLGVGAELRKILREGGSEIPDWLNELLDKRRQRNRSPQGRHQRKRRRGYRY